MNEAPEGFMPPNVKPSPPRSSASVMLSRVSGSGHEVLMGKRSSELPAFPDLWSFPGGGVSSVDRKSAEVHPDWLPEKRKDRIATFTLLREMVEEIGISPDGIGGFLEVEGDVRERVCEDKAAWMEEVESGKISIEGFDSQVITDRVTPPQSPMRFHNLFFHVALGSSKAEPSFPPSRSEFVEFRWWDPRDVISAWEENKLHLPPPIVTIFRDLIHEMEGGDLISACNSLSEDPPSGPHRFEYAAGVECILIPTATLPPATHTNCFILGERGGIRVIIDPAIKDKEGFDELRIKVDEVRKDGSEILCTIFTHRHQDHLADMEIISEIYEAPVWASPETLEAISYSGNTVALHEGFTFHLDGPTSNSKWEVIETPGHCPGQICLVGEQGIVSADNCTMVGSILVPSSDGDMGAYISSLERLRDINPHTLFPGHGPLIPNPKRLLSEYINHRKVRHIKVLEAVKSGHSSVEQIAKKAYSDTPGVHPALSEDQTLSHLKELLRTGEIVLLSDKFQIS